MRPSSISWIRLQARRIRILKFFNSAYDFVNRYNKKNTCIEFLFMTNATCVYKFNDSDFFTIFQPLIFPRASLFEIWNLTFYPGGHKKFHLHVTSNLQPN